MLKHPSILLNVWPWIEHYKTFLESFSKTYKTFIGKNHSGTILNQPFVNDRNQIFGQSLGIYPRTELSGDFLWWLNYGALLLSIHPEIKETFPPCLHMRNFRPHLTLSFAGSKVSACKNMVTFLMGKGTLTPLLMTWKKTVSLIISNFSVNFTNLIVWDFQYLPSSRHTWLRI